MRFFDGLFKLNAFTFNLKKYTGLLFVKGCAKFVFERGDLG